LPGKPVNINTAGLMEFEALPYLGMERSKDIIEYRDKTVRLKAWMNLPILVVSAQRPSIN